MEEVTKQTQAAHRKAVYDFLGGIGVKLTDDQQDELSKLLKSVYETRTREVVIEKKAPTKPQEYVIKCPKCLDVVVKTGFRGRTYLKAVQKEEARQEAEAQSKETA